MKDIVKNQLISAYIGEKIHSIRSVSGGHINKTFLVKGENLYILQALNMDLYADCLDILADNYQCYKAACDINNEKNSDKFEYPEWIKKKDGTYFHIDHSGNIWRMYKYIPSDDPVIFKETGQYETGRGLRKLHSILKTCKNIENIGTTSHLHDLSYHYGEYLKLNEECDKRLKALDIYIRDNIDRFLDITVPADNIIHGDAKVGNMIFRDGKVVGFIDLDTIMIGSVYDDLADCARSCCLNKDGDIDNNAFFKFIKGYEEESDFEFSKDIINLVRMNIEKNCFMLGLRYYTDYLSGKRYFSEEYPGQTLSKARKLLLS